MNAVNKHPHEATVPRISKVGVFMPSLKLVAAVCVVALMTFDGDGKGGELLLFAVVGAFVLIPYTGAKAAFHIASRRYQIANGHLTIIHQTPLTWSGGQRSVPFRRIVSVTVTQGTLGRIFHYGDVHVSLPGRETLTLENIHNPYSLAQLLGFR